MVTALLQFKKLKDGMFRSSSRYVVKIALQVLQQLGLKKKKSIKHQLGNIGPNFSISSANKTEKKI